MISREPPPETPLTPIDRFLQRLGFRRNPSLVLYSLGFSMMGVGTVQIAGSLSGNGSLLGFGLMEYVLLIPPVWLCLYLLLYALPFGRRFRKNPKFPESRE